MGRLEAICISEARGTVKKPVSPAEFRVDHGIVGDAHAGDWHRQVSVLPAESIARMRDKMPSLADGAFAENLIVSGLVEATFALGDRITLGPVVLEVTQIGKECHQGCEIRRITGDCIMPREGLFCRVLVGGQVAVGDAVDLEPGQAPLEAES
ncbi:MOSC domain-containing protein [bacterium CG_4_9_14_3_um_filter_65_15]|nr:MAG: MOSC domain-containing protein [bacterium CG_4_9_14_3_um_filter_65_15]